jgi:excisionase family DNA binding protein
MSESKKNQSTLDLLTTEEIAELLKVPAKTIRQWVYLRRIPNLKMNGLVRFVKKDIETWLQQSSR